METRQPDEYASIQQFLRWKEDNKYAGLSGAKASLSTRWFIPDSALSAYFSPKDRIRQLLKALFSDQDTIYPPDSTLIGDRYLRIFCILICIGKGRFINQFLPHDSMQDDHLPFRSQPHGFPLSTEGNFFQAFRDEQWNFHCPRLRYNMFNIFDAEEILPISAHEIVGRGGSANIYKINVHEEYNLLEPLSWPKDKNQPRRNVFILKQFRGPDARQRFETERKAFMKLKTDNKPVPSIVGYFGSFMQNGISYMILEYADSGTIDDYMRRHTPPSTFQDILTFWESFTALFLALAHIHGSVSADDHDAGRGILLGWHQDIKPRNILVTSKGEDPFRDSQFKLADMGNSHFKKPSRDPTDRDSFGTYDYGAPETFRINDATYSLPLRVQQDVDVWSLGCVFSEVATWVVNGWGAVVSYRLRRAKALSRDLGPDVGEPFHDGLTVLGVVTQNHLELRQRVRLSDTVTPQILQMVDDSMLVASGDRLAARSLYQKSILILARANEARAKEATEEIRQDLATSHLQATTLPALVVPGAVATSNELMPSASAELPNSVLDPTPRNDLAPDLQHIPPQSSDIRAIQFSPRRHPPSPTTSSGTYQSSGDTLWDSRTEGVPPIRSAKSLISSTDLPVPFLTVSEGIKWKQERKAGSKVPAKHAELLSDLKDRDLVFLIDNSQSMQKHWDEVTRLTDLLTYMVKDVDFDGIDLRFTCSNNYAKNIRRSQEVTRLLGSVSWGLASNMGENIGQILEKYENTRLRRGPIWRRRNRQELFKGAPRPLLLYILTDGVWQPNNDPSPVIASLARRLTAVHSLRKRVAIQFITFGLDPRGTHRLQQLDSDFSDAGTSHDIVDTTPSDGNVWKMLLGGVNHWFDNEVGDQETKAYDGN